MPSNSSATYISGRPSWADQTRVDAEAISHSWTAPTVPESIEPGGEIYPAPVEMYREDSLLTYPDGVVLDVGPERVMVLDTVLDLDNARLLAQALLECCDRYEQASAS